MTEAFVPSARAVAAAHGLPAYPFVVIPHPIASDGDAELRSKAEGAVEHLVAILTERSAPA